MIEQPIIMSGAINLTIEKQDDGFKANRWTKNGERGLADRIYVDAPNGIKVGYYDLVKGGWVMDKNNRTHMMGIVDSPDNAKIVLDITGRGIVSIGEKASLMPHEGPIFGHGANLAKDWMINNNLPGTMTRDEFFTACFEGGEAWLAEHRKRYN